MLRDIACAGMLAAGAGNTGAVAKLWMVGCDTVQLLQCDQIVVAGNAKYQAYRLCQSGFCHDVQHGQEWGNTGTASQHQDGAFYFTQVKTAEWTGEAHGNSSGQVGKNFACHPTMSVTAVFDEAVNDFHGATHSLYMDQNTLPNKGGYLLLNAIQDPVEAGFQVEPGTGKPYVAYMSGYKNTIRLISLIHDKNVGEVRWENGQKQIHYTVDDHDFEAMKKGLIATTKILFAAGAKSLYLPSSNRIAIDAPEQIEPVIGGLKNEPARYKYTSFHPQGTCRMGRDPQTTVVNPYGETHDVKNLYVADASLLPTSIGYNPSETVYALASYISDQIVKRHA